MIGNKSEGNLRKTKLEVEYKRIAGLLRTKYAPEKLILFGSLAEGKTSGNSDIDLLIVKRTNKKFTDRIAEVIELCQPKMAVDFIVYTPKEFLMFKQREDFVKKEIIEKGKVIYEKH